MTARTVLTSNTLEEFRTTFNSLSTTDIGDPATLTTVIQGGDVITFAGDTNISAAVTATDTITFTLNSTITGLTSITSSTITDGTATLTGGSFTGIVNITGSGTANFTTDVQINGASVATNGFAIAQAVALG